MDNNTALNIYNAHKNTTRKWSEIHPSEIRRGIKSLQNTYCIVSRKSHDAMFDIFTLTELIYDATHLSELSRPIPILTREMTTVYGHRVVIVDSDSSVVVFHSETTGESFSVVADNETYEQRLIEALNNDQNTAVYGHLVKRFGCFGIFIYLLFAILSNLSV